MSPDLIKAISICLFAALLVLAAVKALSSFSIPNWICVALAAAFVPAALAAGASAHQIMLAVAVGAGAITVGVAMFSLGWLGGGDAKLMAAASLWIGMPGLAPFLLYTGLAGGALALALLALRSAWLRPLVAGCPQWLHRLATPGAASPYGLAIPVWALTAFPAGPLIRVGQAGL